MWPFRRKPRTDTLDRMIAFALNDPATRTDWVWGEAGESIHNDKMGIRILTNRYTTVAGTVMMSGVPVPFDYSARDRIGDAIVARRAREAKEARDAALVAFVDKFERAYGTNAPS